MKKDEKILEKLKMIKHRRKSPMPRPVKFEDKTKYKRSRQKILDRKIIKGD